jgi:hypothetical protein
MGVTAGKQPPASRHGQVAAGSPNFVQNNRQSSVFLIRLDAERVKLQAFVKIK